MAAAVRSTSQLELGTRTNSTIPAPSSIQNGDVLLIIGIAGDEGDQTAPSVTPPPGFSTISGFPQQIVFGAFGYATALHAYIKTASGESGDYTMQHGEADTEWFMYAISGATVQDVTASIDTGTGDVVDVPSVSTQEDESLVVLVVLTWDGVGPTTPPGGTTPSFTERYDPGGDGVMYVADGVLATTGATGGKVMGTENGSTAPWAVGVIAINAGDGPPPPDSVGTGTLAAQASTVAGTGEREVTGAGALGAQGATSSGSGTTFASIAGSGALEAQAVVLAGSGILLNVRNLVLTQAQGREMRNEKGITVELNGIIYEWYDDPDSTDGEPDESGTFNTDENGEATVVLSNSSLTDGHVGGLLLIHPSDPTIRGYYRVPVTLTQ